MNNGASSGTKPDVDQLVRGEFFNRELSALAFNNRVLAQAGDERFPWLERWRFLCIAAANLDEFFEIRVAGLKQLRDAGSTQRSTDGLTAGEQLEAIHLAARELLCDQYRALNDVLLPGLAAADVVLQDRSGWNIATCEWVERYFLTEVEPLLSPLRLDPARPFPRIQNKGLHYFVRLAGHDALGRAVEHAVVQVPRSLPRVLAPPHGEGKLFVALSSIIEHGIARVFVGLQVLGCHAFRLTRNSDLFVEDDADDLRLALEGELAQRRYGAAVRLETASDCLPSVVELLRQQFGLEASDCYSVDGPVNLNRLAALYELAVRPDLKFAPFVPGVPAALRAPNDPFAVLRAGDVLLHHPYESFEPVIALLRFAAADPAVLAIKQTLYRSGAHSPIVESLIVAAQAGKDVTAVIELRARFDEEANIELATQLQDAGAHVVYGIVGYKTHAKLMLVVRREAEGLRRYCHLGTGNYHPQTARAYTDYGLLTSDRAIGNDVHQSFLMLTSLARAPHLRRLLDAPLHLHQALLRLIDGECAAARAGRPARIVAKLNALTEPVLIRALYRASAAGVAIELIVRGVCALRPGVAGLSERISVRSLVGRFLEHSRVYWFENGGQHRCLLASADWMERSFFRRVELAFPVLDLALRSRLRSDLELSLRDEANSWRLQPDGRSTRCGTNQSSPCDAQQELLRSYDNAAVAAN
jgi:polyphosphate kinase